MTFDKETLDQIKESLYSAVICDILDEFGFRNQAMAPFIVPLDPIQKIVGRAFTVMVTDVFEIPEKPYEKEIEAVDSLTEGDVLIVQAGSPRSAFWGELLSTAAVARGARGTILDGYCRDTAKIKAMGYPVFCKGNLPYDSKGRNEVTSYQVPIECGGVLVNSGDFIFGDVDGTVVVPKEIVDQVIELAMAKVCTENLVRDAIKSGSSVAETFKKYGAL